MEPECGEKAWRSTTLSRGLHRKSGTRGGARDQSVTVGRSVGRQTCCLGTTSMQALDYLINHHTPSSLQDDGREHICQDGRQGP